MITKRQIEDFSERLKIDQFSVFREYLQVLFLNYFYREKETEKIYFKGGTCLHFFFNSPRFSEDLDFSTLISEKKIKDLVKRVEKNLKLEVPEIKISFLWRGKQALRFKLKYQGKDFKYPLTIRLDFSFEKIFLKPLLNHLKTIFPVSFSSLIFHLDKREILAEKTRAFLWRAKGRDLYDLWFLLEKGIEFDKKILEKKLKTINQKFDKKIFLEKIKKYPEKELRLDLTKFLPSPERKIIPSLKERLILKLTELK